MTGAWEEASNENIWLPKRSERTALCHCRWKDRASGAYQRGRGKPPRFPADCSTEAAQVTWLYREFERIFHTHPDITKVVIKKGEFTQGDNNAKRVASYQEAALLLYCGLHNKPVVTKIYASLATRSAQVKDHAIARVGQTTRYWDSKMADAVIAAWREQPTHEQSCHHRAPNRSRSLVAQQI